MMQADKVSQLKDDIRTAEARLTSIHKPKGNPITDYEEAKKRYEAGKIGSAALAEYKEAARVAQWRGEV